MLISISVENFKSFDNLTEVKLISSSKIQTHIDHKVKIKSTNILKYGVFYGANAAGKSNLVKFIQFFIHCVQSGLPMDSSQMFCKNKKENKEKESNFELQFTIGKCFYAYGFSAILSRRKITGEWLYELNQDGSAKCLFEREDILPPKLGKSVSLTGAEKERFYVYSDDFAGSETSLFLSEMNNGKKYTPHSKLLFFKDIYEWLCSHIYIIMPDTPLVDLEYYYDNSTLSVINELISTFDTGISEIRIDEISLDELSNMVPRPVFNDMMSHIRMKMTEGDYDNFKMTMRSKDSFFNISVKKNEEPKITTIRLHHGKTFFDFDFLEESDGTRRLFDLMDMLLNKKEDIVYVVDELERSLHPKLLEHFLSLFMELHQEQRTQLLFTTHEASIMEQSLFRRDEIWFIERDETNASSVYSLDRFKERYDKILSKAYLEGRYGAVPVFSSFRFKEGDLL